MEEPCLSRIAIFLFATALLVYTPGIWWGLPHATAADRVKPWGQDELAPLGPVAELYSIATQSPNFNPQYPMLHYVVEAVFVGPYLACLWLTGQFSVPSVVYPFGLADPITALKVMTVLGRAVNLLMGAGIVVAAWRTACILWGARAGLLAGAFTMLLYPMFYYSRTSNVDLGAMFWTAWGFVVFAFAQRDGLTVRRAAALGLLAAFATATKDHSYAAFAPLGVAVLFSEVRRQRKLGGSWRDVQRPAMAALGTSIAAYLVASGAIFHPVRHLAHMLFVMRGPVIIGKQSIYFSTPATFAGYATLLQDVASNVAESTGLPMLLAGVVGVGLCCARSRASLAPLGPCFGIVAGVILPVRFVQFRFVFLLAYTVALFAGCAVASLIEVKKNVWSRTGLACATVICGWALLRGADLTYQMLHDPRYQAGEYLAQNGSPGDVVGYYGASLKLPALTSAMKTVLMPESGFRVSSLQREPEFIVIIPQQINEPIHERELAESAYRSLAEGSVNYRLVRRLQAASLFKERPVRFVNPPVEIYARKDRLETLP
jgi:hypothetical protein